VAEEVQLRKLQSQPAPINLERQEMIYQLLFFCLFNTPAVMIYFLS
jgi:hypothetical protein